MNSSNDDKAIADRVRAATPCLTYPGQIHASDGDYGSCDRSPAAWVHYFLTGNETETS